MFFNSYIQNSHPFHHVSSIDGPPMLAFDSVVVPTHRLLLNLNAVTGASFLFAWGLVHRRRIIRMDGSECTSGCQKNNNWWVRTHRYRPPLVFLFFFLQRSAKARSVGHLGSRIQNVMDSGLFAKEASYKSGKSISKF